MILIFKTKEGYLDSVKFCCNDMIAATKEDAVILDQREGVKLVGLITFERRIFKCPFCQESIKYYDNTSTIAKQLKKEHSDNTFYWKNYQL